MKHIMRTVVTLICVLMLSTVTLAADIDLPSLGDEELKQLYEDIRTEMTARGIPISKTITLREGKFVIGQDILPGTYTITCMETDGEKLGDAYSSLGSALDSIDEENSGAGGLMDALGGMMEDVALTRVEVLGDYGSVLKSFEMKSGETASITLEENTALEVTGGTIALESE